MGGEIFADSEGAGKGTTVTFYLPLLRTDATPSGDSVTPFASDGAPIRGFSALLPALEASDTGCAFPLASPEGAAQQQNPAEDNSVGTALRSSSGTAPEETSASLPGAGRGNGAAEGLWQAPLSPPGSPQVPASAQASALRTTSGSAGGNSSQTSLERAAGAAPAAAPGAQKPALVGRVLAAEDDRASQLVLRKTLQKLGFDPLVVGDGQQALDAWRDEPTAFDMVRGVSGTSTLPLFLCPTR